MESLLYWSDSKTLFFRWVYILLGLLLAFALVPVAPTRWFERFKPAKAVLSPWIFSVIVVAFILVGRWPGLFYPSALNPDEDQLVVAAMAFPSFIALFAWFAVGGSDIVPRGVIVSDMVISILALSSFRLGLRAYREKLIRPLNGAVDGRRRRIAIVGAGSAGAALLRDIQGRRGLGLEVVCFIYDDRTKIGGSLHGKQVIGPTRRLASLVRELDLQKIVIAMPTAKPSVIQELVQLINKTGIDHDILPSVEQLLHKQVSVEFLRHVSPEDVLGREPVHLDESGLKDLISNKTVLVTGAGGSIGSELCRQIASFSPQHLILIERAEPALFLIEQEIRSRFAHVPVHPLAASVCRSENLRQIFLQFRPAIVFHAAAHKHVPLMEHQPAEAFQNNCLGTYNVAQAAIESGCSKAILVSTDKAVNPVNVMGATKRAAEQIWSAVQARSDHDCLFSAVRFGNVLGSSGSVIPTFRKQIAKGGPVTVTHPEVTRYFMSIPEACGLILQSAQLTSGGEIFVLDMGEPVRIVDLASQMIQLSGFVPERDISIVFTGLRPGEKLYEEPIHSKELVSDTPHPKVKILRQDPDKSVPNEWILQIEKIAAGGIHCSREDFKKQLAGFVPEYQIWKE